jgi:hypothetical protein
MSSRIQSVVQLRKIITRRADVDVRMRSRCNIHEDIVVAAFEHLTGSSGSRMRNEIATLRSTQLAGSGADGFHPPESLQKATSVCTGP